MNEISRLFVCLLERYLGGSLCVLPNLSLKTGICHTHTHTYCRQAMKAELVVNLCNGFAVRLSLKGRFFFVYGEAWFQNRSPHWRLCKCMWLFIYAVNCGMCCLVFHVKTDYAGRRSFYNVLSCIYQFFHLFATDASRLTVALFSMHACVQLCKKKYLHSDL